MLVLSIRRWLIRLGCGLCAAAVAGCVAMRAPEPDTRGPAEALTVLVSSAAPAFARVGEGVAKASPLPGDMHYLDSRRGSARAALRNAQPAPVVVAVGLEAARFARQQAPGAPLVFCQIVDYEAAGLVRDGVRGVKAIPPLAKQFEAWKTLDPRLERIAVITGPELSSLHAEAASAAQKLGLALERVEVRTDKEWLYQAKRLAKQVDGLWIAPDYRVLSAQVMREAIGHFMRNGKQVLAFSPELLPLGALMSAEPDPDDVIARVVRQVDATQSRRRRDEPAVASLSRVNVRVNPVVARQLGLAIPEAWRGGSVVF